MVFSLMDKIENKGLLFIPDISGFTRFVNESEIEHTRLIIQELLESLINSNEIGLEISEIEGDAILFYKFGDPPDLKELYRQVEKMFCDFHAHLISYDRRRFCQCKACNSAIDLTIKVISHYGEFTSYRVKNFNKLIGKDIIVAHQLLKNDIEQHEYWLVTNSLMRDAYPAELDQWIKWKSSSKQVESGDIGYYYTPLSELKNKVPPVILPEVNLADKVQMFTITKEYETDIITLFHAAGDFRYRSRWRVGVKAVEGLDHALPRIGMSCKCIGTKGEWMIYSNSYRYQDDRIEFSETDEKGHVIVFYILEKLADKRSRLTLNYYLKKNITDQLIFKLIQKRKIKADLQESLVNMDQLIKEIEVPAVV